RLAFVAPVLVLAYLLTWQTSLNRQIRGTSNGVLAASIGNRREWIDERAGRNTDVADLWTGAVTPLQIEEPEFFNRSVDRVYALEGAPPMGAQLPEVPTTTEPGTGVLLGPGNQPVVVPYVLADSSTTPQGKPLQSDPHSGLTLFRTFGVVRLRDVASGRFADGWSGPSVAYRRFDCRPGRLVATVSRYPGLVRGRQTVAAFAGGRRVARVALAAGAAPRTLLI